VGDDLSVTTGTRVERFLAHLDGLSGGREPQFWPVESNHPGHHRLTAIGYHDLPEQGLLTGITYGLSLARQEAWIHGRPELSICVRSADPTWVLAIAYLADSLLHDCPFTYGSTINFGEPISDDSQLDGFVVFAPLVVGPEDSRVDVGDDLPINIVGMYPTYASERRFISEHGLEAFWTLGWDPYDTSRDAVV